MIFIAVPDLVWMSEKNKKEHSDELEKVYEFLYGKNQFALDRF